MSVKVTPIYVEPTLEIQMPMVTGKVLAALLTGVECTSTGIVAQGIRDLYHAFKDAGLLSGDETFSDYFSGKVTTKPVLARKT